MFTPERGQGGSLVIRSVIPALFDGRPEQRAAVLTPGRVTEQCFCRQFRLKSCREPRPHSLLGTIRLTLSGCYGLKMLQMALCFHVHVDLGPTDIADREM